jgi:hypothetical protein
MGDEFLDLPPAEARVKLQLLNIAPDYFLESPADPDVKGLIAARQRLARLIGLPVPGDDGLHTTLEDLYHHLFVGPVSPEEIASWEDNPWVQVVGSPEPEWDCDYPTWRAEISGAVPTVPFQVNLANAQVNHELPSRVRVERSGAAWVVRDERGSFWCGLIENGWTDTPDDDMPALTFPTEAEARAAYAEADRMYGERQKRHEKAMARLGIADE